MGNCPQKPINLFASQSALDKEIKYFFCSYPGCFFKSKGICNVSRHEKIHNKSGECAIPCQVCLKTFGSLVFFFHHLSTCHANRLFCPFCRFVSQDLTKIKSHVLNHSLTFSSNQPISKRTTTGFRCSTCSKSFTLKGNLAQHQKNNRCQVNHAPATIGSLKAQERTSRRDVNGKAGPAVRCNTCCTSFTLKKSLYRHQRNHRCGSKLLKSAAKKAPNVRSSKVPKPKRADEESQNGVGRVVRRQRALYACRQCSFTTYYVTSLRRHHRVHSSEMPFKCTNLGCDYKSHWVHNLQRHQRNGCKGREIQSKTSIESKPNFGPAVELVNKNQVNAERSSRIVALACSLCNFIGDSQVSALKHSCEHKTVDILLNRI